MPPTPLANASTANTAIKLYLATAAVAGVTVVILSALRHWGFYGFGGGAMLMLVGIGGGIGLVKQGGFAIVTCPGCGHSGRIQFARMHRTLQCGQCDAWIHGAESMAIVPPDYEAPEPAFWIALPNDAVFDRTTCLQCGDAATQQVVLEATKGAATAVVLGAGVITTLRLTVPACARHPVPGSLVSDPAAPAKVALGFHRIERWNAFCVANHVSPQAPAAKRLAVATS